MDNYLLGIVLHRTHDIGTRTICGSSAPVNGFISISEEIRNKMNFAECKKCFK